MTLYTYKELNDKLANTMISLVNVKFTIDENRSYSDDRNFHAVLVHKIINREFMIHTLEDDDKYTYTMVYKNRDCLGSPIKMNFKYYKSHDDIYAESQEEADEEHKKWLALNLGLV